MTPKPLNKKLISLGIVLLISLSILLAALDIYLLAGKRNVSISESTSSIASSIINFENPKQLIVVISMDGLGSNLITEDVQFLYSLLSDNQTSYTLDMQSLVQSETMPSHISMVTGLTQEHHGFYANSVDELTPPITSKTIFDYAVSNNYSYYAFLTKDKLLYLLGNRTGNNISSHEELSGDVLDSIDSMIETDDPKVLLFIHLRDMDNYGHAYGWNSSEQKEALIVLDDNLELLIADLEEEFADYDKYFILTADHGGEGTQHSNGCEACRRIPLIVVSETSKPKYMLDHPTYNIYDVACIVLGIMEETGAENLDCDL